MTDQHPPYLRSTDAHETPPLQPKPKRNDQPHPTYRQKPIDEHQEGKTDEFGRWDHPILLGRDG